MRDFSLERSIRRGVTAFLVACALSGFAWTAKADALSDAAGSYRIDGSSSISFVVEQAGGGGIRGSFPDYSGSFRIDGSNVGKSSVTITLYPGSVRAKEARVENFLRSDAVFDVARYPEITFRSTSVERTGDAMARIVGTLTARGRSRKAEFAARVRRQGKGSISFHVTGAIYRSPYGMDVGTPIYSNLVKFDMTLNGRRN